MILLPLKERALYCPKVPVWRPLYVANRLSAASSMNTAHAHRRCPDFIQLCRRSVQIGRDHTAAVGYRSNARSSARGSIFPSPARCQ